MGANKTSRRRIFGACVVALLMLPVGCGKGPTRPFPSPPSFIPPSIDDYPAWSNDGSSIAYFRFVSSADGPTGIYIVNKWGGRPRLVAPGLFYAFRFSPDDRYLVCVTFFASIQVAIIDVATGAITQPFAVAPGRLVQRPHWSPDGHRIVYARGWSFSEPPDSGGIHIFDLRTGEDRSIGGPETILIGFEPQWLPTGQISFIGGDEIGRERLMAVDPDGQDLRVLYTSRGTDSFWSHHWYHRPAAGLEGVLFTDNDAPPYGGTFLVQPDGSVLTRLQPLGPPLLGWDHEAFSPDGEELVHHGFDPVDSLDILFVTRVGDQGEVTQRQLTRYSPPPGPTQAPSAPAAATVFRSSLPSGAMRFRHAPHDGRFDPDVRQRLALLRHGAPLVRGW